MNEQLGPAKTRRTTPAEVRQIAEMIGRKFNGRLENFTILATPGGLILNGRAPTYYMKQVAQHAVMELTCLPIVANKVEVSWSIWR